MPHSQTLRYKFEKITILPQRKDSDNSDHRDDIRLQNKRKYFRSSIPLLTLSTVATNNRRGFGKRIIRHLLCAFTIPMLLFLIFYGAIFSNSSSRHYPLVDWDFNVSLNISEYILPFNDTTSLEPRNKCHEKMFILIIVCSRLNNFVARQTIRETWGNTTEFNYSLFEKLHSNLKERYLQPKLQRIVLFQEFFRGNGNQTHTIQPENFGVKILFLVGHNKSDMLMSDTAGEVDNETHMRLQQEAEQYDDIVQENFLDTYNNLTIKSVMALKWMTRNKCFEKAVFFMKCDDDTFVNIPNLIQFLLGGTVPLYNDTLDFYDSRTYKTLSEMNRLNASTDYMVGYMFCKSVVLSDVKSKWYMPYYMYTKNYYPTYLSGSGYLMSMDVVPQLYEASLNTSLVYLEDVYVTGLCAEKANITRHHHPLFHFDRYKNKCVLKGIITIHNLKPEDMYEAYNFLTNLTNHCPPPRTFMKRFRLGKRSSCN